MKRIEFIDSLKGLAIFLVLWGHSIQYVRDKSTFINNIVFEDIYSFHMPLFFMLSGLFFKSSLKLNFKDFFYKKTTQLMLPCFVWAVILMSYRFVSSFFGEPGSFHTMEEIDLLTSPSRWPLWFLKELFLSYSITYVAFKLAKQEWLAFTLCIAFALVMPYGGYQRFLLPFFLAGIYFKDKYEFIYRHLDYILPIVGIAFGVCLFFWKGNYTIYATKFPALIDLKLLIKLKRPDFNFSHLGISAFRLLTGLAGSLFALTLFQKIHRKNAFYSQLGKIGTYTLGIYILQVIVLEELINRYVDFSSTNIWVYNLLITPLLSLAVLYTCLAGAIVVNKNKYARFLLFGN